MTKLHVVLVMLTFLVFPVQSSFAGGAANYDECILDGVKGAAPAALRMIEGACRMQFTDTAPPTSAPSTGQPRQKLICWGEEVISDRMVSIYFPVPMKPDKDGLRWRTYRASLTSISTEKGMVTIQIKHDYPFNVSAARVRVYPAQESDEPAWEYTCSGYAPPDVPGEFKCGPSKSDSRWYRVEMVANSLMSLSLLGEAVKECRQE